MKKRIAEVNAHGRVIRVYTLNEIATESLRKRLSTLNTGAEISHGSHRLRILPSSEKVEVQKRCDCGGLIN